MMWKVLLVAAVAHALFGVAAADDYFVFKGDPYTDTAFPVDSIKHVALWRWNGVKYHSIVYFPSTPGKYSVFYFIGGLGGIIPAEFYSHLLEKIAAMGFVVIGVDHFLGGVYPPSAETVLQWHKDHLQHYIDKDTPGVIADWDSVGLGGHSGGAQSVLEMVLTDPHVSKATMFLEGGWPFFMKKALRDKIMHGINFTHPAMVYATEYATRRSLILPECGTPGQAEDLYTKWSCPRILVNVTGFGHCDMLNDLGWYGCHYSDFCYTTSSNNRTLYRDFVKGYFSAFLVHYVQGNTDVSLEARWVQTEDAQVDVQCDTAPASVQAAAMPAETPSKPAVLAAWEQREEQGKFWALQ